MVAWRIGEADVHQRQVITITVTLQSTLGKVEEADIISVMKIIHYAIPRIL